MNNSTICLGSDVDLQESCVIDNNNILLENTLKRVGEQERTIEMLKKDNALLAQENSTLEKQNLAFKKELEENDPTNQELEQKYAESIRTIKELERKVDSCIQKTSQYRLEGTFEQHSQELEYIEEELQEVEMILDMDLHEYQL